MFDAIVSQRQKLYVRLIECKNILVTIRFKFLFRPKSWKKRGILFCTQQGIVVTQSGEIENVCALHIVAFLFNCRKNVGFNTAYIKREFTSFISFLVCTYFTSERLKRLRNKNKSHYEIQRLQEMNFRKLSIIFPVCIHEFFERENHQGNKKR